jgi:hypothetical protein
MHKNNAFVVVSWLPFICQSEPGHKSSKIGFDDMVVELQENCGGKEIYVQLVFPNFKIGDKFSTFFILHYS